MYFKCTNACPSLKLGLRLDSFVQCLSFAFQRAVMSAAASITPQLAPAVTDDTLELLFNENDGILNVSAKLVSRCEAWSSFENSLL